MLSFNVSLHRSAAIWTAPLWAAVTTLYFVINRGPVHSWERWAPMLVDWVTKSVGALTYAAAFGLAIWAGGQVKRDGVWILAPARSRVRIAAGALAAPIGLAWAILLVPVAVRLVSLRLPPTPLAATVEPVAMTLGIGVCWAAAGFVIGQVAPRLLAAPLGVAVCWYLVMSAASYDRPAWPRHVLGQVDGGLDFGERYRLITIGVPLLFAILAAAAVVGIWLSRGIALRIAIVIVTPVALAACAHLASGWKLASAPVTSAMPRRSCHQGTPEVCIAEAGGQASHLNAISRTIDATYAALRHAGVHVRTPSRIVDTLLVHGRGSLPAGAVRVPLTIDAAHEGMPGISLDALSIAIPFHCAPPDLDLMGKTVPHWMTAYDSAMSWAAGKVGVAADYRHGMRARYAEIGRRGDRAATRVSQRVAAVDRLSPGAQAAWFARQRQRVCRLAHREAGH